MVRVRDLHDQTGRRGPHALLHCVVCGNDNSANKGDYFMARSDYMFTCCGQPMVLAVRRTVYRHVEP